MSQQNIKLAYMFTTPNSASAFERLRFASCITVCINPNSNVLEAAKRKIHAGPGGVTIGAVSYPYQKAGGFPGEIDKARGLHEVSAVKTASMAYKCFIDDDGKMSPLFYDPKNRMFKDLYGNYIHSRNVVYKHFNSQLLSQQRGLLQQGKELTIHPDYFRWMERVAEKKRVIDVANKVGEEMTDVTQEVYFGGYTPSDQIRWPDIFLRTYQVVSIKETAVDDYILRAARFPEGSFSVEFVPHQGVVTRIEKNEEDGVYYIDLTRVANESTPQERLFRLTDKVTTLDIPFCEYTNLYLDQVCDKEAGDLVSDEEVISKTTRIVELIGYHPTLTDVNEIKSHMSERFLRKLRRFAVDANQTMINNVPATSFNFLKELPPGVDWQNDVFMRNVKTRGLYYGPIDSLRGKLNDFIEYDLIHHSFYDYVPGVSNHGNSSGENSVVLDTNANFGNRLNIEV